MQNFTLLEKLKFFGHKLNDLKKITKKFKKRKRFLNMVVVSTICLLLSYKDMFFYK
jgi:hypothetical protein